LRKAARWEGAPEQEFAEPIRVSRER
jgi:hypothetical protein